MCIQKRPRTKKEEEHCPTVSLRILPEVDETHQGNIIKASSDLLHIHGGPITRARAKNMQATLNGLIEKM